MSYRVPVKSTAVMPSRRAKVAMASVSWISPPAPGGVLSKMSKISGGSTQRPKMEYRENSWPGWGFSTMSVQRK